MKWIRRLLKFSLFFAIFLFVIFTVMAGIGGSSDSLRKGIEQYASEEMQRPVKIEVLNDMRFFPDIVVDVERIIAQQSFDDLDIVATAEHIRLVMSFWDVAFDNGKIKDIKIKNIDAEAGVVADEHLFIENVHIEDTESPYMILTGRYGEKLFDKKIEMLKDEKSFRFAQSDALVELMGELGLVDLQESPK